MSLVKFMRLLSRAFVLLLILTGVLWGQTTPNLGLNIPAPGTLNWGGLANFNFSKLDSVLACHGTATVAGTIEYFNGSAWLCFAGNTSGTKLLQQDSTGHFSWVSPASGITLQTNGTPNGSQTLLNIAGSSPITATDNGTGTVTLACPTCGTSTGTVTSFSAGTLSPLFTTSVATPTTTPALTFALSNAAANTIFANFTGSSAAPSYSTINGGVTCGDSTHALSYTNGTGFGCQSITGSPGAGTQYIYVPNCGVTGTTNNHVAKWGNNSVNNSCATITTTGDGGAGVQVPVIGIVVSGGGTTGNAQIAIGGQAQCQLDATSGGVIQGSTVIVSSSIAGDCVQIGLNDTPANENPDTHFALGLADQAASASTLATVDVTPIVNAYGNVGPANKVPPFMTALGSASYGGTYALPLELYQTNSTAKSGIHLGTPVPLEYADPTNSSFYTLIQQCGTGGTTCGSSSHDFQFDVNTNGFSGNAMFRFVGTHYSVPFTGNVSGIWGIGGGTNFSLAQSGNALFPVLTGNTTMRTPNFGNAGALYAFDITQDGTGGRTFAWDPLFKNPTAIPAALSTGVTQLFVFDGTNLQPAAPAAPITVVKTSQAAAITTTTITTPQAAMMMRVTATLDCTTTSASATVTGTIGWTDPSNTAQTATIPTATCTTLGSSSISQLITAFRIKSATAVTYSTAIANTPTYDLSIALETMTP